MFLAAHLLKYLCQLCYVFNGLIRSRKLSCSGYLYHLINKETLNIYCEFISKKEKKKKYKLLSTFKENAVQLERSGPWMKNYQTLQNSIMWKAKLFNELISYIKNTTQNVFLFKESRKEFCKPEVAIGCQQARRQTSFDVPAQCCNRMN